MILFGALLLIALILLRPFEVWPDLLGPLHLIEATIVLLTAGLIYESFSTKDPIASRTPAFRWMGAYILWICAVTIIRLGADGALTILRAYMFVPIVTGLVGFSLRSVDRLKVAAKLLLFCLVFVSGIAIHQSTQDAQCVEVRRDEVTQEESLVGDGRACEGRRMCENNGQPGVDYMCEKVGLFGSVTTGSRSRWRGQLGDPNETSIYIMVVLPFLLVFGVKRDPVTKVEKRTISSIVISLIIVGIGLYAAVLTGSRGGMMVLGLVALMIFVRRFGWKAVPAIALMVAPLVLASWRSGDEAEASQKERSGILSDGLELLRSFALIGVGLAQFAKESSIGMAAHNSYLLTAVELGLPGYVIWIGMLWMTAKVPLAVLQNPPPNLDPDLKRLCEAFAASLVGMLLGIFFLSFTYKQVFFLWLGLSAALYGAIVRDHPEFKLPFGKKDVAGMTALAIVMLIWVKIAARQK